MSLDRRDTFRVRPATREPIRVELVTSGMLEIGSLRDISEGGIGVRLETAADVEVPGIELELLIGFPGTPGVYAKGVVRRIRRDGGGHVLGIEFIDLPAKALEAIRHYIGDRGRRHSGQLRIGS